MSNNLADSIERARIAELLRRRRCGESLTMAEAAELRRFEAKRDDDARRRLFSRCPQKVISDLLGVQRKTLLEWHGMGMPRNADKTYDLAAVFQWLRKHWTEKPAVDPRAEARAKADEDKAREQIRKLARENAVAEGALIERAAVATALDEQTLLFRQGLREMDMRVSMRLVGLSSLEEVRTILQAEHRDLCERWSKALRKFSG